MPERWLADRLLDLPPFVTLHGALTLGDSALASLIALDGTFLPTTTESGAPPWRQVADIDMRLLWGDFLAKLRLQHRRIHHPEDAAMTHDDGPRR